MRTLKQINAVYEKIIHSDDLSERVKGMKFASLMSEMLKDYNISEQRNEEWIAIFRKISNSRLANSKTR